MQANRRIGLDLGIGRHTFLIAVPRKLTSNCIVCCNRRDRTEDLFDCALLAPSTGCNPGHLLEHMLWFRQSLIAVG